jgi:hypothetical protein
VPAKIGDAFPPDDVVGRWVFKLATLLDDLALIDTLMRDDWDKEPNNSVAFFRMIVSRLYEARPIVREMQNTASVAQFLSEEVRGADAAAQFLRDAYRRPDPDTKSRVESTYATVRHLTVHYSTRRGELPRVLRKARDVDVRIFRHKDERSLIYLFPQDVMELVLWPDHAERDGQIEFAHELVQAFTRLFIHVMGPYFRRMGVDEDDIHWVGPGDGQS